MEGNDTTHTRHGRLGRDRNAIDGQRTKVPWTWFCTRAVLLLLSNVVHNCHTWNMTARKTQLIPWPSAAWDAPDTWSLSENWQRDETKRLNNDNRGSDFNTREIYELYFHCKHTIQDFVSASTLVININALDNDTLLMIWWFGFNFRCLRKIANSDYYIRHVCLSVSPSVCPSIWNNWTLTEWMLMKLFNTIFFWSMSRKFKIHYIQTNITGTSHEDLRILMISRLVLLRIRNFSDRNCRENHKKLFVFISWSLWDNVETCTSWNGHRY
jgi:hypothetical protein